MYIIMFEIRMYILFKFQIKLFLSYFWSLNKTITHLSKYGALYFEQAIFRQIMAWKLPVATLKRVESHGPIYNHVFDAKLAMITQSKQQKMLIVTIHNTSYL